MKPTLTFLGQVRRGRVYALSTGKRELEVYVSDKGGSLRVWDPKVGKELKP